MTGGRRLPSVAVVIDESPAGGTARAELVRLLRETGFEVPDDPKRGDVLLTGKAFGEAVVRHGAMWSAAARIELEAVRRSTGAAITSDRQRAVAVDLSDALAARAALEDAVGPLAARLLPKLAEK